MYIFYAYLFKQSEEADIDIERGVTNLLVMVGAFRSARPSVRLTGTRKMDIIRDDQDTI